MNVDAFWRKVDTAGNCWEWTGHRDRLGYGKLTVDGKGMLAHRVSFRLAYGLLPDDLCVCHHCDNPSCVRPDHLFLGTRGDNNRDRAAKGRTGANVGLTMSRYPERRARGERQGSAKLTQAKVDEIRRRYAAGGCSHRELAKEYQVGKTTISEVLRGENWRPRDWHAGTIEEVLR